MSRSSHRQSRFSTSSLPEVDYDEINANLLPLQVSAANIPTAVRLHSTIRNLIQLDPKCNHPDLLVITDINLRLAIQLWRRLEQLESRALRKSFDSVTGEFTIKMPTPVHNCALEWFTLSIRQWIRTGLINTPESDIMFTQVADTLTLTQGVFANSRKEPDVHLNINGLNFPTLCCEVGFSESKPRLESDMRKLLIGGQGHITAVFLIKWYNRTAGVAGTVELWKLDANGNPGKQREEAIFPRPPWPQAPFTLTRQELFGAALQQGRSPTIVFTFSLDDLRTRARAAMVKQSLVPL
ncbi:hypothetical protein PENDEC_c009G01981 [Penicillium decumbens]|uniref:Uncharacterized protein n=1 Tax=Penicillium decumbens TaxID=69771 RepID=A0A1V6PD14_PENDC|nr:hypothetical protein PENDEC_c009G01981 [Penicillium decumbens]